jgi:hypothetical protein
VSAALDPALGALARLVLAAVLLAAARHKLADRARFRAALAGYGLLPARGVRPAAAILPIAELALALALLAPRLGAAPPLAVAALLALYGAAIAVNLARGRRALDCGCGARPRPLGWGLVARNAALVALALAAALPAQARALGWLDAWTIAAGAATLALLHAAADALLAGGAGLRSLGGRA